MLRTVSVLLAMLLAVIALGAEAQLPSAARPPQLAVASHYLADFATGTMLAQNDADTPVPPASLTKLMTAYVVFEALAAGRIHLEDEAPVSEKAWRTGGTRMFIDVNSRVKVDDLVHGMLIQSGNDASVALAELVAGSVPAFVALMNDRAAALGMHSSVFRNPTGLPARGHVSSAHDLAILARALIEQFPQYYGLYAQRQFTYNGITQHNRNALLARDPSVDGMKTGHTAAAGYCLVTSAQRDGMRLIAVVLGATTPKARNDGAEKLLNWGFANYETHKLYVKGERLTAVRIRGALPDSAPLGITRDLYVTIPRGQYAALAADMRLAGALAPPLTRGTEVGELQVSFAGSPLAAVPLVALENVQPGGVLTKVLDQVSSWWGEAEAAPP